MFSKSIFRLIIFILLALTGCNGGEYEAIIGERPSWSPDGSTIAYRRLPYNTDDTAGIWLVDTDGTNDRYLCSGISADWSPDGERLVIATPDWNICLIDKDGSNFEYLVHDWSSNSPTWSPDGEWIAFVRPFAPGGLFWKNIETDEYGGIPHVGGGDWSPDSRHIVYVCYEDQGRRPMLKIVDIMDSTTLTVKEFDSGDIYGDPRWSPDGEKILFVLGRHICVVDTSGKNLRKLAKDGLDPDWSPDGEKIVYATTGYVPELWIMNANGRNEHPLGEE